MCERENICVCACVSVRVCLGAYAFVQMNTHTSHGDIRGAGAADEVFTMACTSTQPNYN